MGGNNNFMSKKGWNPSNMANQVKVGEAEAAAIRIRKEEAKKEEEVRKERAQEAIKREQAIAAGRPINTRVDWMYEGPSSGQNGTKEELEAVLLGKSRIDRFVKGNEGENLKKGAEIGVGGIGTGGGEAQTVSAARDIASKVREDPMLAIKRQEQAAYERMMSDPRQRERLLQAIGGPKPAEKERKHRHHHRRHRDEQDGDNRRDNKRRRTDSEDRDRRHRHSRRRSRSRTPERRRSSPGRDRRRDEPERDSRRRRSFSRSRSPPRRRRSPTDSRSPPPRRRSPSPPLRRRSPSPRRMSRSPPPRRRSPSPRRRHSPPRWRDGPSRHDGRAADRPNGRSYQPRPSAPAAPPISAEEQKAEMERRLAAMQADATSLDIDREKRLAALAEREKADREAEMTQAMKAQKYGGKADFVNGLHRQAGERDLGDRLGAMKAGRRLEGRGSE